MKAGLYCAASDDLIDYYKARIAHSRCNFVINRACISLDSVNVAWQFDSILQTKRTSRGSFKTSFCNSGVEALHGAIKLLRHNALQLGSRNCVVDLWDPEMHLKSHLALERGEPPLIDGLRFRSSWDEYQPEMEGNYFILKVSADEAQWPTVYQACKVLAKRGVVIIDLADLSIVEVRKFLALEDTPFDGVIWGEGMAGAQLPFGAFSVRPELMKVWESLENSNLHSTTYGGNSAVLNWVCLKIEQHFPDSKVPVSVARNKLKSYQNFINSAAPALNHSIGLHFTVEKANGSLLDISFGKKDKNRTIIDGVGAMGCSLRGHNHMQVISGVLNCHDPRFDYWAELKSELSQLVKLDKFFPAVSGGSAVENAIVLALAASEKKRKVVVFKGNFSGKTLIALNGTSNDSDRLPFGPLYGETIYVDPFESDAASKIVSSVDFADVCLVLFEYVQGGNLQTIPPHIVDLIVRERRKHGFFIAVDEVLHGLYRCGQPLSYHGTSLTPDLVTFSKGLCDLMYPFGVTCASSDLVDEARQNSPSTVALRESFYVNQFGSHIALNVLKWAREANLAERVEATAQVILGRFSSLNRPNSYISGLRNFGLHFRIIPNYNKWPLNILGPVLSDLVMTRLFLAEAGLLTFQLRLLPELTIQRELAHLMVERMCIVAHLSPKTVAKCGLYVFGSLLSFMVKERIEAFAKASAMKN